MYKISKNKYLKIFLTIIISLSITTGIMYEQKKEVEAVVVALPVVAIPIIKAIIATGVTFATTDAMLEAYNQFTQTDTFNTVSGKFLADMNQNIEDYLAQQEVQELLDYHFPGGQVPDPNDPDWNTYKNLTLGTIGVSLLNKWEDVILWVGDKFSIGTNDINKEVLINHTEDPTEYTIPAPIRERTISVHNNGYNGKLEIKKYGIDGKIVELIATNQDGLVNTAYARTDKPITLYTSGGTSSRVKFCKPGSTSISILEMVAQRATGTNIAPTIIPKPYIGEEILNDPSRKHINETTEKEEVLLPLPIEIVEYDEDQQKWVLNPNKEMDLNDIKKQLEPLVDKNYQDVAKEQPTPTNIPNPNPNPDPDPYPNPDETPIPDPSTPGNPPPGTGTPVDPSTGEPLNPDDYRIPDLLRFIFWIILLIIKLILKMIMLVINLFRIPATPDVIPRQARDVILFIKNNKLPGFEASFYSIITTVGGLLLSIRFVKIFVNYFKGSSNDYEREAESIIKTKYNEMQQRNKWRTQREKLDAKTGFSRRKP